MYHSLCTSLCLRAFSPVFTWKPGIYVWFTYQLFVQDGETAQNRNVLVEVTDPFSWRLSDAHVTSADHTAVYTRFVTAGVTIDAVVDELGFAERNASDAVEFFFMNSRTTSAPRQLLCRHGAAAAHSHHDCCCVDTSEGWAIMVNEVPYSSVRSRPDRSRSEKWPVAYYANDAGEPISGQITRFRVNSRRHTLLEMEGSRVCPALGSAGGAAVLSRFDVGVRSLLCVCGGAEKNAFFTVSGEEQLAQLICEDLANVLWIDKIANYFTVRCRQYDQLLILCFLAQTTTTTAAAAAAAAAACTHLPEQ